tara:strand:+ start:2807 stop:3781 length:975 start_codon:yes stop_codon:yes gene_type:complete
MEDDLNRTGFTESEQGLFPDAMSEGSINYQHLDQTHFFGDELTLNYGSCLFSVEGVHSGSRGYLYSDYWAHGGVDDEAYGLRPDAEKSGPGWSFGDGLENGVLISQNGSGINVPPLYSGEAYVEEEGEGYTLLSGRWHTTAQLIFDSPIKIGTVFDSGGIGNAACAFMLLFDTILMSGSGYGVGVELQILLGHTDLASSDRVWAPIYHSERWMHDPHSGRGGDLADINIINLGNKERNEVPPFNQPVNIRTLVTQALAARIAKEYTDFSDTHIGVLRVYGFRAKAIAGTSTSWGHTMGGAGTLPRKPFAFQKNKLSVMAFKGAQ